MTLEELDQLNIETMEKITNSDSLTEKVGILCSFIKKLEKKAQPKNQAYETKRIEYINDAYTVLNKYIPQIRKIYENSAQRFHLEDNEIIHENWHGVSEEKTKKTVKQANKLIAEIDHDKREWQELNKFIENLPEDSRKQTLKNLLETIAPLANKLDDFKAPLAFFGLKQKYYQLTWNIEEEDIPVRDAEKIINDSIQELKNAREKIQEQNRIQKINQLIERFQTLKDSLPEIASRQNSIHQVQFSDNNVYHTYSIASTQSSQSTQLYEEEETLTASSSSNVDNSSSFYSPSNPSNRKRTDSFDATDTDAPLSKQRKIS